MICTTKEQNKELMGVYCTTKGGDWECTAQLKEEIGSELHN